jgi:predicted DNA-binding protein (MmcQ/YjbR family)
MDESRLLPRLREICLAFPEVRETTKWSHPTFEAGKKIFAVLDRYGGRVFVAFRALPERLRALLAQERFCEAPNAARRSWVCLDADGPLDCREVEGLLRDSYRPVPLKRMLTALDKREEARRKANRRTKSKP